MKVAPSPQNPMEWFALKSNLVPVPLGHTQIMFVLSRAVLIATKLNVFEAAKDAPLSIEELAAACGINKRALQSLMHLLTSAGYFHADHEKYALTKMARKWCLKDSETSVYHQQMYNLIGWDWMSYMEEFLHTGKGLQYHDTFTDEQWKWYQSGMEDVSKGTAKIAPRKMPVPANATDMLDIGGSHGLYSVEVCKKFPAMKAVILELPKGVEHAKPLLAKHNLGDRVTYWAGDARKEDLGENKYDVILISSLMHHFTGEENIAISQKAARALKPEGIYVIQEFARPEEGNQMEMLGAINDLYFNLTSTSGSWSLKELKGFQTLAGLNHFKVNTFISLPGFVQVCARKG